MENGQLIGSELIQDFMFHIHEILTYLFKLQFLDLIVCTVQIFLAVKEASLLCVSTSYLRPNWPLGCW
jgi:hypothetical protein